jgi:hypothetical protein
MKKTFSLFLLALMFGCSSSSDDGQQTGPINNPIDIVGIWRVKSLYVGNDETNIVSPCELQLTTAEFEANGDCSVKIGGSGVNNACFTTSYPYDEYTVSDGKIILSNLETGKTRTFTAEILDNRLYIEDLSYTDAQGNHIIAEANRNKRGYKKD